MTKQEKIEELRETLNAVFKSYKNKEDIRTSYDEVLALSKELDGHIVDSMKEMNANKKKDYD